MNRYKSYGKGWHFESHRHSLAAKGIKTRLSMVGVDYDNIRKNLLLEDLYGATSKLCRDDKEVDKIVSEIAEKIKKDELKTKDDVYKYLDEESAKNLSKKSMAGKRSSFMPLPEDTEDWLRRALAQRKWNKKDINDYVIAFKKEDHEKQKEIISRQKQMFDAQERYGGGAYRVAIAGKGQGGKIK